MKHATFATALNCMDGRAQRPVIDWIARTFGVDHVDMITEPGIVRMLEAPLPDASEHLLQKIRISREAHGSRLLVVVAHHDCAGNPVDEETQKKQLVEAGHHLKDRFPDMTVRALWLDDAFVAYEIELD